MDIEAGLGNELGQRALDLLEGVPTPKSALRMRYAAETKVFRDQHGGLENIRQKLGFSRRKMCQLLLVDPSAWTRWMKDESRVPPHIYRSLEWFLALNEKSLTNPDLAAVFQHRYRIRTPEISSEVEGRLEVLARDIQRQKQIILYLTACLGALAVSLLFSIFI